MNKLKQVLYTSILFSFLGQVFLSGCKKESTIVEHDLIADFTFKEIAPGVIAFENKSTGMDNYEWDFGDSSIASFEYSPIHSYFRAGNYTVTLTLIVKGKVRTVQKQVTITNTLSPSTVYIKSVVLTKLPDSESGSPDVYFQIFGESGQYFEIASPFYGVKNGVLPLEWFVKNNKNRELKKWDEDYKISLHDFNRPGGDGGYGVFYFMPNKYTSGANKYPSSVLIKASNPYYEFDGYLKLLWQ